jgi:arsenate reductase (glutaredoxin)
MAGEYVLWFDARGSGSRRALALLRERGVEPALRRHLVEPPTPEEVRELLRRLGLPAIAALRHDEDEVQALRLSDRSSEEELVQAVAAHPRILDRPILVRGDRAVVARPPERVLELLDEAPGPGATGPGTEPFPEPVRLPLDGTLDLHAFSPAEVGELVPEFVRASAEAGLLELRIVHGKGTGALRERVHALLGRDGRVASFRLAGEDGGGWGATLVTLKAPGPAAR